jgi:cyclopropane-fatty-acyl-phospholipid synthase
VALASSFVATKTGSPLLAWAWRHLDAQLAPAGIVLNGNRPWDPHINRFRAVTRVLTRGSLGAGDAYVDGDWDCDALDEFMARVLRAAADRPFEKCLPALAGDFSARMRNRQTRRRARRDIAAHYDIGNDLYAAMLGSTMAYSCAYWVGADSLDAAQDAKHDLICRKLRLRPGLRVLDVGCGWGAFAAFAAQHYGVAVVGITISAAQAAEARRRCAGLPVEIREVDYRDVDDRFDRVVSVGMLEHVGPRNYPTYFETLARVLDPDGLALVHAIGGRRSMQASDPWIARYVFPDAVLPSAAQLTRAFEGRFVLEDWHNFGAEYDRTLRAWYGNFEAAWPQLAGRYSDRFHRVWRYYLLGCAGTFRARHNQLWQLVLSPRGVPGGYRR